jgi:hypothetical protein
MVMTGPFGLPLAFADSPLQRLTLTIPEFLKIDT